MKRDYAEAVSEENITTAKNALEKNGFTVFVAQNPDEARQKVLGIIPNGSEVFTATSVTLDELGLSESLNDPESYVSARDKFVPLAQNPETKLDARRLGSASEYAVGSVHAVTEDGTVLIASNSGSQIPNYVYGADNVIWVVGAQKIVKNIEEGMDRIENHTYVLENERAKKAYGTGSVLSKVVLYKKDPPKRVTIVIVNQAIGY